MRLMTRGHLIVNQGSFRYAINSRALQLHNSALAVLRDTKSRPATSLQQYSVSIAETFLSSGSLSSCFLKKQLSVVPNPYRLLPSNTCVCFRLPSDCLNFSLITVNESTVRTFSLDKSLWSYLKLQQRTKARRESCVTRLVH